MDFNAFMTELIKKECQLMGREKVMPVVDKCGIKTDAIGTVLSVGPGDKAGIVENFIMSLYALSPLAKIAAWAVIQVYKKYDPDFNVTFWQRN